MPYHVTLRQDQLSDIVKHLEHVRAYYAAEASAMSQASMPGPGTAGIRNMP